VIELELKFKFVFPPLYGVFDTGDGTIYIFGDQDGKLIDVINHETLHYVVMEVAGKEACLQLDNIDADWTRV
jgi:hypothetical protein